MGSDALSPAALFESVGLEPGGFVGWGTVVPSDSPGVYVVSLHPDPQSGEGLNRPPLHSEAMVEWLTCCAGLTLHGARLDADMLLSHLGRWWLPRTSILYIGKAGRQSLRRRVKQYYDTPLGARRPHGGGYWLKTLSVLRALTVHYVEMPEHRGDEEDPVQKAEDELLNAFLLLYGEPPNAHPEPSLALPYANLEVVHPAPRRRRHHGLPSLVDQAYRCG